MKALFFCICLLNLVFLLWEFHAGAFNSPVQISSGLPSIILVDELERARRGAVISSYLDRDATKLLRLHAEKAVDKPLVMRRVAKPKKVEIAKEQPLPCHEVGPFTDASTANAWLLRQKLRGDVFNKETLMPTAFQVYFPAAKTPEQTRIQKMMLNAKGVTDIWMVPSGELKGALSLGLFNDRNRAVIFKNQLLQRGLQAEIKVRNKTLIRSFVKIDGDQLIPQALPEGLMSTDCTNHK